MLAWMGGKRKKFELWKRAKTNGTRGANEGNSNFAAKGFSEQYTRLASLPSSPGISPRKLSGEIKAPKPRFLRDRKYHGYEPMLEDPHEERNNDSKEIERAHSEGVVVEPAADAVRTPISFFSPDSIENVHAHVDVTPRAPAKPPLTEIENRKEIEASEVKAVNEVNLKATSGTMTPSPERPKLILKKRPRARARSAPTFPRSLDLCMISMEDLK